MRLRTSHPATLASGVVVVFIVTASATAQTPSRGDRALLANGSRVYVKDPYVRDAVVKALRGASEWLRAPRCQRLLTEFSDDRGRALTDHLAELRMNLDEYLGALIIEDGERHARCAEESVLAFTVTGSRVIHVCGRAFARAAQRNAEEARATILHELLHSLGLGENPPSPRQITYRVRELCW